LRSVATVLGTLIGLFVVYLIVGGIVDGYLGGDIVPDDAVPNSWAAPDSWSEWRDIVIVVVGSFMVFAAIALLGVMVALLLLLVSIRNLLRNNVAPAVDSLKGSLDNIRGTTEFAGETVASPLIRAYSIVKGVRTGVGAVTGLPDRVRGRKKKGRRR
jgi:hypothetical protein